MSFKNRMLSRLPTGLRRAVDDVRRELRMARYHRKGRRDATKYANAKSLKLHAGCGLNPKPGWVNIDLAQKEDLSLDLRERIPLPDGSAQMIYSEHFFEHLDYPGDAMHFLKECVRLLEPGGTFSIGVPDTRWPLLGYGNVESGYFEAADLRRWHPAWCRTKMEHINYHFRQDGEHRFAWDLETLEQALREAGFVEIRQRSYRPDLDTEARALGTLYVDALAPAKG